MLFRNINSLNELKKQYRELAMKHHPDVGGNLEIMQQVNEEFDMLFKVWKIKDKVTTTETAATYSSEFYTENGWKGCNYDINLRTKDITKIIRDAVKLMYPTCKFSVTFESYSGGSSIIVALMEAPYNVFVNDEVITSHYIDRTTEIQKYIQLNQYHLNKDERITEQCRAMLEDVNELITSYRRDDSDSMIDYFDTNFYYHINIGKWNKDFEVVEKTLRIGQKPNFKDKGIVVSDNKSANQSTENNYSYDIKEDIDTRDNSEIFVVKIVEKLDKDEYIEVSKYMRTIGGYYSRFKHGFIFKENPTEILNGKNNVSYNSNKGETFVAKINNKEKLIEKINKQIESINKKIESLSGNYQTNTYKRMREQESREVKIRGFEFDIDILKYLLNTLETRDLTVLETALMTDTFRTDIDGYYRRNKLYNSSDRPSSSMPIKYPEINSEYDNEHWWNKEVPKKQKRLNKGGIHNQSDLLKAVEEYKNILNIALQPVDYKAEKIKKLERELKMTQKGDINFTPKNVVEKLIELAHIDNNSLVLEPSAGIGNIADEIKKVTNNLDVVEQMSSFRELLSLKGHNLVGFDFLEYETDKKYDAIIANPPFSDEQNHIKHMYDMLKDGGTLVTICSPHWTFANDKKSIEFKNWVENENSFIDDLASGTFEMTGVASKILVIEKPINQSISA